MELECLCYEKREGIGIIRFNRPRVLNAMNHRFWLDLKAVLEDARINPEIKVLIFTGEGRAFSTGADLKESKTRTPEQYREYLRELQEISRQLIRLEKPTIAAINGYALGSGYELALACDIRLAAEDAQIGSPEVRVTSSVTGGAMRLLQDIVGPGKARELLFTAENISGKEAERIGLVNQVLPLDRLLDEAVALAQKIAVNSAFSLSMVKKGLRLAQDGVSLEALMDFEVEACLACVFTKEREQSLKQFEERKKEE